MVFYYFFAALVMVQGFLSLRGGVRYLAYVKRALREELPVFTPAVTVIVPCRGVEQGLRDNLLSVLAQDYPDYEVIFVVDERGDAAVCVIEELMRVEKRAAVRLVVAGPARECGQKVHNLRRAVPEARMASQVFVFVDSDARPHRTWIRDLVAPLGDVRIGATTGYRWFVPKRRNLASMLRAVWNASIASALGPDVRRNFCWGGSTAIRRDTLEQLNVLEQWRGTVSDDFALTRALRHQKLSIRFVPQCLVASHETLNWPKLFEFTNRQIKITRVYAPHLWHIVLWTNLVFVGVFYGGLMLTIARAAANQPFIWTLACVAIIFFLGAAKALYRLRAISLILRGHERTSPSNLIAYLFLWPLTALIYLYNALVALFSRRIKWRGITYELKSPSETVIIRALSE